jgi:hypothetical protein
MVWQRPWDPECNRWPETIASRWWSTLGLHRPSSRCFEQRMGCAARSRLRSDRPLRTSSGTFAPRITGVRCSPSTTGPAGHSFGTPVTPTRSSRSRTRCDEFATFLRATLGTIGCETRIVTVGFRPTGGHEANPQLFADPIFNLMTSPHPRLPGPFTHVFAQAQKPNRSWVTVDPVAGPRTGKMHKRVKQLRIYQERDDE